MDSSRLVAHHLTNATDRYRQAFHDHLALLRPDLLDELRWFFLSRAAVPVCDTRYQRAVRAFGAPKFRVLYRAWLERGERVLDATLSPVLAEAIDSRRGQLECHVLPHRYLHLLPLVGTA